MILYYFCVTKILVRFSVKTGGILLLFMFFVTASSNLLINYIFLRGYCSSLDLHYHLIFYRFTFTEFLPSCIRTHTLFYDRNDIWAWVDSINIEPLVRQMSNNPLKKSTFYSPFIIITYFAFELFILHLKIFLNLNNDDTL